MWFRTEAKPVSRRGSGSLGPVAHRLRRCRPRRTTGARRDGGREVCVGALASGRVVRALAAPTTRRLGAVREECSPLPRVVRVTPFDAGAPWRAVVDAVVDVVPDERGETSLTARVGLFGSGRSPADRRSCLARRCEPRGRDVTAVARSVSVPWLLAAWSGPFRRRVRRLVLQAVALPFENPAGMFDHLGGLAAMASR